MITKWFVCSSSTVCNTSSSAFGISNLLDYEHAVDFKGAGLMMKLYYNFMISLLYLFIVVILIVAFYISNLFIFIFLTSSLNLSKGMT